VEQFERIRRDRRDDGLSIRELARRHRVHRRTVRQVLADAVPPARKTPVRTAPVLGPYEEIVRDWLIEDKDAPRKQRHTARRVWQRLVEEKGVQVAESSVRALVARIRAETGVPREVPVPQTHPAGREAEVDFGEFYAVIAGVLERLWMFVLRLSHSGKAVHIAYANQAAESFLDGHVRAFEVLGGVPTSMIRYDNLKPAVIKVLLGRQRWENPRFVALRSHYGYDSFYCLPGKDGAHEKGGVEGEIGRFRRRHLTPVPHVGSLAALNEVPAAADAADDARRIEARTQTVGAMFEVERASLNPLPHNDFDTSTALTCRVDAKSRICVRQSYYSVPVRLVGRKVTARLGARTVVALADGKLVASHDRSLHKGTEDLALDHYLEILARKPGALAGATARVTARANGSFTPSHQRFWDAARRALGRAAHHRDRGRVRDRPGGGSPLHRGRRHPVRRDLRQRLHLAGRRGQGPAVRAGLRRPLPRSGRDRGRCTPDVVRRTPDAGRRGRRAGRTPPSCPVARRSGCCGSTGTPRWSASSGAAPPTSR
jgi:transcriptional regulator with XRE-family HTH domain